MSASDLPIEIDCASVARNLESHQSFVLIDCREADEYELARIGQAKLLPMSELTARVAELEPYRNHLIAVHCHHGGRSLRVANWLRNQGFAQAQSMAGGIDRWAIEIDPSLTRY